MIPLLLNDIISIKEKYCLRKSSSVRNSKQNRKTRDRTIPGILVSFWQKEVLNGTLKLLMMMLLALTDRVLDNWSFKHETAKTFFRLIVVGCWLDWQKTKACSNLRLGAMA